jgi:hypothetical protein
MPQTTQYVRMPRWPYWKFPDPPRPPPFQDPDLPKPEQRPQNPIIKTGGGPLPPRPSVPRPVPGF